MKYSYLRIAIWFVTILLLSNGCKKEDAATIPVLAAVNISALTSVSANINGNITSDGGSTITERGVCWSTEHDPTITDTKATGGSLGIGSYTTNISGLTGNTIYYVRAYATNSIGTGYSDEKPFTTSALSEYAITTKATEVKSTIATLHGSVNANFLSTAVTFEYGTSANYGQTIAASQSPLTGNNVTAVSASLTGLNAFVTYHFRIKIVSSAGTAFGDDMTFTTNYVVGEPGLGGIVFYVDNTGQHGLVFAVNNYGSYISWDNGSSKITNASGTAVGTGWANTKAIVDAHGAGNYAAYLCDTLMLNGFSDWFLPSIEELHLIDNLSGFGSSINYYWSSSEFDSDNAWYCKHTNNLSFASGNLSKTSTYSVGYITGTQIPFTVRAIRAY